MRIQAYVSLEIDFLLLYKMVDNLFEVVNHSHAVVGIFAVVTIEYLDGELI